MAPRRPLKRKIQQSLEVSGAILPKVKKPLELIGKQIKVPGSFWGSSATATEQKKLYVCTIVDYQLARIFNRGSGEEEDYKKADGFKLTEMGTEGQGGNSEDFWMEYPHQEQSIAQSPADGEADVQLTQDESNEKIYENMKLLRAYKSTEGKQKGRLCSKYKCQIVRKCNGMPRHNMECESPITIWGKSTGPFFKHVRCLAKRGCESHIQLLAELNKLSVRQIQLENGEFIAVHTFEEMFAHHIRFVWLVATGMPIRLNRNSMIAACIDEVQLAKQHRRRQSLIKLYGDTPFMGLQLDLYTDRVTGISYVSIHITYCVEGAEDMLQLVDELLEFRAFPYTSHTATDIENWLVDLLVAYEIPTSSIIGVTPDGEQAGRKGIAAVPGLAYKSNDFMVDGDMADVDEIELIVDIAGESLFNQAQPAGQNVMPVQLASTPDQSNEYVSDEDMVDVDEMMKHLSIVVEMMEVESFLNQAQPGHQVKRMLDKGVEVPAKRQRIV
ncbi:hypothetical protein AB1Y20_021684 [Prymnesium parvum]|uniref:Uncharacterized protein n=1 Tax=Prymnesium parvum TaxID=97485 RepID=A0AB34JMX5_PRYPA